MPTRLSQLAANERTVLTNLRSAEADRGTLLELMHTSCLLELSKLGRAGMDLATFVRTVVDVLTQFFVIDGCRVEVIPDGLPRADAGAGEIDADRALVFPLTTPEGLSGSLTVCGGPATHADASFFALAADHAATALSGLLLNERLRRQAAAATAMRLAASLDERTIEETLDTLVDALAALANATGAVLEVDHPLTGAPLRLTAGVLGQVVTEHNVALEAGGVVVHVSWADAPHEAQLSILGEVVSVLVASITRCEEARRLREEVEVDPLTGVGNRRRAARVLAQALSRAERHLEPVSVLVLDLDHFKDVNDRCGHPAGDALLKAFAEMLVEQVRGYDTVVRAGGEEFLIVCPAIDAIGARALAERLRSSTPACGQAAIGDDVTVSIGIAVYPQSADYPDGLIRKADGALYEAKRAGRNTVAVADTGAGEPTW